MNRFILSAITGFVLFFVVTFFTLNPFIGMVVGILAFVLLPYLTDPKTIKQNRLNREKKHRERKEEKQWRRESYHKEYGEQRAREEADKERKYNDYNELDIRNIIPKTNPLKKFWGN